MPSIYLIRHGQASFGQQNYDALSELGVQQAAKLGDSLRNRVDQFDQVCLGSMFRHQQTAESCLTSMQMQSDPTDWNKDPGWNEYDHQDILAQMGPQFATADSIQRYVASQENPKAVFEKLFNDAMNRWMSGENDSDYVETWSHYQSRIKQALNHVCETFSQAKNVAVFTSGGPISVIAQYLLGVPAEKIMQMNWTLVNCGVTKVISTGRRTFVSSMNEHPHFEGEHKHLVTYK